MDLGTLASGSRSRPASTRPPLPIPGADGSRLALSLAHKRPRAPRDPLQILGPAPAPRPHSFPPARLHSPACLPACLPASAGQVPRSLACSLAAAQPAVHLGTALSRARTLSPLPHPAPPNPHPLDKPYKLLWARFGKPSATLTCFFFEQTRNHSLGVVWCQVEIPYERECCCFELESLPRWSSDLIYSVLRSDFYSLVVNTHHHLHARLLSPSIDKLTLVYLTYRNTDFFLCESLLFFSPLGQLSGSWQEMVHN